VSSFFLNKSGNFHFSSCISPGVFALPGVANFPPLAADWFLALSSSLLVLSSTGAGLGQTLSFWTVPDPGALFAPGAGSGQSKALRMAQVSTGKG